jgi:rhodanese-related sulfurtransferase
MFFQRKIPQITVHDFRDLNKKKPLVIDVSPMEVYKQKHVPHSVNIPLKILLKDPKQYLTESAYLICDTGKLSHKAVQKLHSTYRVTWVEGGTLQFGRHYKVERIQTIKAKDK